MNKKVKQYRTKPKPPPKQAEVLCDDIRKPTPVQLSATAALRYRLLRQSFANAGDVHVTSVSKMSCKKHTDTQILNYSHDEIRLGNSSERKLRRIRC